MHTFHGLSSLGLPDKTPSIDGSKGQMPISMGPNRCTDFTVGGIERYLLAQLGSDPIETRAENYLKVLKGIGIDGVRTFIASLLKDGIPDGVVKNSYFHPNKFFKLGICRVSNNVKLRLHFWSKEHLEVQTPIHFHAWDFASLLVTGSYLHETFTVSDVDEAKLLQIKEYQKEPTASSPTELPENCYGMYKIPKRDGVSGKFRPELSKYVQVQCRSSKTETQGSAYFLDMEFPHQLTIDLKEVGAMITLVITSETYPERVFTFQPLTRDKVFDNPSPNVDEAIVRAQLETILSEIDKTYASSH